MKISKRDTDTIRKIVKGNHFVSNRIEELEMYGYSVNVFSMGSGGVLQTKHMKNGKTRIQISAGWGRHNYAYAVEL